MNWRNSWACSSPEPVVETQNRKPEVFSAPVTPLPEISTLPLSLQGIEKKLIELESMISDLPDNEIVQTVEQDPWNVADANLSFPISELPAY